MAGRQKKEGGVGGEEWWTEDLPPNIFSNPKPI
jgi:hypothetical protein